MNNIIEFAKARWYWVLGGVLGIYIVYRLYSQSSTSSSTPAGSNPYAAYSDPSVLAANSADSAAIQVAQIQANSAQATAQVAGAQQISLAQIAQAVQANNNATSITLDNQDNNTAMWINGQNIAGTLALNNQNNNTQMWLNGQNTQAAVAVAKLQADVAENASNNGVLINGQNTSASVAINGQNDSAAMHLSDNQTQLGIINSNNELAAYGIQGQVATTQINALQQVADAQTAAQQESTDALTNAYLQAQLSSNALASQRISTTQSIVGSGVLNKGGEGGLNQLAAWTAAMNPASAPYGVAGAAQVGSAQAAGSAMDTASIVKGITSVAPTALNLLFG